MMTFEEARLRFRVGPGELATWIRYQWVKPHRQDEDWLFDDCDLARIQLICDLRALEVNEEAVPIVLSLVDQLYATRNALAHYRQLLRTLPDPAVEAVIEALQTARHR